MAKKRQLKSRKLNFLKNFYSIDTQFDLKGMRQVEIYQVLQFYLKFEKSSSICNFFYDHQTIA